MYSALHFHARVFTTHFFYSTCNFFYHQYLGFVGCFGTFGGAILLLSIQSLILVPKFGEHNICFLCEDYRTRDF